MTRKRVLMWALALMVALTVGHLLGRGFAWLKVYGEPRRELIIQFVSDCEECHVPHEKPHFRRVEI